MAQASSSTAAVEANPHMSLDAGLLMSTDASALDRAQYDNEDTREALFQLPITQHPDHGPLAALPAPIYPLLPREKPLPKPKPETKWEKFAKRKGISSNKQKDKLVWDDETKEWVPRYGFKGKNKNEEEQWIHELPANAGDDFNPVANARKQRKERNLHNKAQQLKNITRAAAVEGKKSSPDDAAKGRAGSLGSGVASDAAAKRRDERSSRISQLEAETRRSRASTASMGRFDKRLEGEDKEKGIKRKFDANEVDAGRERSANLALLDKMASGAVRASKRSGEADLVNARKAVRFASGGKGAVSLAGGKARAQGGKKRRA